MKEFLIRFRQDDKGRVWVTAEDGDGDHIFDGHCSWWDGICSSLLRGCVESVARMFCATDGEKKAGA